MYSSSSRRPTAPVKLTDDLISRTLTEKERSSLETARSKGTFRHSHSSSAGDGGFLHRFTATLPDVSKFASGRLTEALFFKVHSDSSFLAKKTGKKTGILDEAIVLLLEHQSSKAFIQVGLVEWGGPRNSICSVSAETTAGAKKEVLITFEPGFYDIPTPRTMIESFTYQWDPTEQQEADEWDEEAPLLSKK